MAKRKRNTNGDATAATEVVSSKKIKPTTPKPNTIPVTIQIIAGSYDRVLHGITATLSSTTTDFADSFLFDAHQSAIKCLAVSSPSTHQKGALQKVILATGSTDERIQLYHLSAHPPSKSNKPILPSLNGKKIIEDPQNKELGALLHHASSITALCFPTRSKLMSSSEDSTIAVTRTRDWSLLSSIKAPIPKPLGRPSGDTAPLGGTPSGINDFAVHSSLKLMISVSKGEKSMRLWNLLTGKKAGVLNFGRDVLAEIGEGRFGSGEGRKVGWGATGDGKEEFCVGFDRGVLVFGMDSKVKCKVVADGRSKIHQLRYVEIDGDENTLLAMSTEDGRILFYSTRDEDLIKTPEVEGKGSGLPSAKFVAQLGGKAAGVIGRIKDFVVLTPTIEEGRKEGVKIIVTAGSDGVIRLWKLTVEELASALASTTSSKESEKASKKDKKKDQEKKKEEEKEKVKQIATLLGTTETTNRITCLAAFVMIPRPEGVEAEELATYGNGEDDEEGEEEVESSDSDEE